MPMVLTFIKAQLITFQARHFRMGNVDKYQFNKWHERLFTFKSGKKRYKAGKTGSMGG